jgi:hypothetical protein
MRPILVERGDLLAGQARLAFEQSIHPISRPTPATAFCSGGALDWVWRTPHPRL